MKFDKLFKTQIPLKEWLKAGWTPSNILLMLWMLESLKEEEVNPQVDKKWSERWAYDCPD